MWVWNKNIIKHKELQKVYHTKTPLTCEKILPEECCKYMGSKGK